jgi:hypothetical protein
LIPTFLSKVEQIKINKAVEKLDKSKAMWIGHLLLDLLN